MSAGQLSYNFRGSKNCDEQHENLSCANIQTQSKDERNDMEIQIDCIEPPVHGIAEKAETTNFVAERGENATQNQSYNIN